MSEDGADLVPTYIHDLERMLSVALLVQDVDPGPPATITAAAPLPTTHGTAPAI